MEDKLKRYEKIEFLGEGQVFNVLCLLLDISKKKLVSESSCVDKLAFVYVSDNMENTLVLVKNRTSRGSLGSRQTTHACDTSLETAIKMLHFDTIRKYVLQHTKK